VRLADYRRSYVMIERDLVRAEGVSMGVKEKLDSHSFFDGAILSHGFTPYMRDYELVAEVDGTDNKEGAGRFCYRFTYCVQVGYITSLPDAGWLAAWDDVYTDYARWKQAGGPVGFVWGVAWASAYPGLVYLEGSATANSWSERLGRPMHDIRIETNVFSLSLIFHDVVITRLSDEVTILDRVNIPIEP
jgi:hypothetical protein